jgi:hypothetical protein
MDQRPTLIPWTDVGIVGVSGSVGPWGGEKDPLFYWKHTLIVPQAVSEAGLSVGTQYSWPQVEEFAASGRITLFPQALFPHSWTRLIVLSNALLQAFREELEWAPDIQSLQFHEGIAFLLDHADAVPWANKVVAVLLQLIHVRLLRASPTPQTLDAIRGVIRLNGISDDTDGLWALSIFEGVSLWFLEPRTVSEVFNVRLLTRFPKEQTAAYWERWQRTVSMTAQIYTTRATVAEALQTPIGHVSE